MARVSIANLKGPQGIQGLRGFPGVNAVPADEAVAVYLAAPDSETGQAFRETLNDVSNKVDAAAFGVQASSADNTAAMQAAMDAAVVTGKTLELPAGTLKTGALQINGPISIVGKGKGVTKLSYTSSTAGITLRSSGSITANVTTVTANVARGDSTITVASTASLAVGDYIVLHDTASYVSTDASYKSGEQLRVKQIVSATQFVVHGNVRGSWGDAGRAYTTANGARISKLNFVEGVHISNLTIFTPMTQTSGAIRLEYVKTITIDNVEVAAGGTLGIFLMSCRDATIDNFTCHDLTNDLGNGFNGYAITLSQACENVTITGGHIYNVRHGFTTIGGTYGMCHGVTVTGVTLSECTGNALDTHAAGDGVIFNGNVISNGVGGISIRSRDTMVVNNVIRNVTSHGITISEGIAGTIDVRNNSICRVTDGNHGIAVREKVDNLRIVSNTIEDVGADGIWVSADSNTVYIADNYIKNVGRSLTGRHGIIAHTTGGVTPVTGGWQVIGNMFVQAIGSAARAVYGTGGLGWTMMSVYNNFATGTFTVTYFEFAASKGAGNLNI